MILVFADQRDGNLKKASKEAISEGKRLATSLSLPLGVVVIGTGAKGVVDEIKKYGADKVFVSETPDAYSPDLYAEGVAKIAKENGAKIVLFPATSMCVDFAPRVSAKLEAGLVTDITATELKDGKLVVKKPVYSGKAIATVEYKSDIAMATLRPNVFELEENAGAGEVVEFSVDGDAKAKAIKVELKEAGKVELTEASIIVSGGRGVKGPEYFQNELQQLADLLGAAVGASRAAVDAGWIDHSHQVGQTGKVVSPKVYMAFGISGAIQHLAGMGTSQYIIAVNKDPDAPIFNVASLGVVADLFKVVPALIEEIKKAKA